MPAVVEGAVPSPLHLSSKSHTWPASFSPLKFSPAPTSSPAVTMSPEMHPFMPHLNDQALPTSGWYSSPVPAPDCQNEVRQPDTNPVNPIY